MGAACHHVHPGLLCSGPLLQEVLQLLTMCKLIPAGSCSADFWGQGTSTQVAAV